MSSQVRSGMRYAYTYYVSVYQIMSVLAGAGVKWSLHGVLVTSVPTQ